ncbi:MAG: glutamate synthase large subunit [Ottowia sp.]|nr:glutamate synthase large subunit [Ottowia sp.]
MTGGQVQGLYDPAHEHDACGVGFVAHIKGCASHRIIEQGLKILENLDHRGAVGADVLMGDGAGILIQIPDALYRAELAEQNVQLPPAGEYGVGMVFLPKEHASRQACMQELERAVRLEGQVLLGWRYVPVDATIPMSPLVRATEPTICQIFIGRGRDVMTTDALERKLYVIRKRTSHAVHALALQHGREYFVPSMSARTVVYKGLLLANQVGAYYRDLRDPRAVTALAMVHQRFSTNTFPAWQLAHPYRMIAHNGEINTVKGNVNWVNARTGAISSPMLGNDLPKLWPLIYPGQSDTASFDNCLELLVMAGYPLAHAMMMMIPEAWEHHALMDENRRAFYEYHAAMMEPWDGPAAMIFTDGRQIGATLDRNGLRPARLTMTHDGIVVMASEAGVLQFPEDNIAKKWRLQPGKMFLLDMEQGRIVDDKVLKDNLANAKPYKSWVDAVRIKLDKISLKQTIGYLATTSAVSQKISLLKYQQSFAYNQEDMRFLLAPMALSGEEESAVTEGDVPLAVLSNRHQPLFNYFKQLFAQVTNPPIDAVRENIVMSLVSFIGPKPNLLDTNNINPPMRLEVAQPILDFNDMEKIHDIAHYTNGKFCSCRINICYPVIWGKEGIEARLASLCAQAEDAVKSGYNILIVSDVGVDADHVAIPALLASSAIHQHLVARGLRTSTGLVVETGAACEVHHFALLAGYGAEAIHPYLALKTIVDQSKGLLGPLSADQAIKNFIKAVGKGLQKIMSRMGISTYMSYTGSQVFEAVGLSYEVVDKYFKGTSSGVSGINIFDIAQEAHSAHQSAFGSESLPAFLAQDEVAIERDGDHVQQSVQVAMLEAATRLRSAAQANCYDDYKKYAAFIYDQHGLHHTLRGLLEFKVDPASAIPLGQVEPVTEIVKRFVLSACPGLVLSDVQDVLSDAIHCLDGYAGVGQPSTQASRFESRNMVCAKVKTVSASRFGVTAAYLVDADQIQIRIAQETKLSEGELSTHLSVSRSQTAIGVGFHSPPPHHDIYSIEDLAQLIHDLKSVNHRADISVRLMSEVGVGTVVAGVVKSKADHVVITGHDGISSWSSKHAGSPWELGLAEAQQTLMINGLRGRVRVQLDGQLKTGRDVVIAALLGAEEFGLALTQLSDVSSDAVNPAGQNAVGRGEHFVEPTHVVNYFFFVAQEVRELMAQLGIRHFDALVGHTDLLSMKKDISHWKAQSLDFSRIFYQPRACASAIRIKSELQSHGLEHGLDHWLIHQARGALDTGERVCMMQSVSNVNRTVGAMLSGEIARRYGHRGLPDDTIRIQMTGTAGQSFGAFLAKGVTLELVGDANDSVGKGLSGGIIIARLPLDFHGDATQNIIVGNAVLYGAVYGEAFFNGVAGERFAVRNSGARVVVEGVGDHGCEYMTGGVVVILGETGRNFAAGMTGGVAYVYDEDSLFAQRCNTSTITLLPVLPAIHDSSVLCIPPQGYAEIKKENDMPVCDEHMLKSLIEQHVRHTGSQRARMILADWSNMRSKFVKVCPLEHKRSIHTHPVRVVDTVVLA